MLSIPQYLLESSFCLAIFYSFYHLFLKKETFFQLNRAYLLVTPIAALSIPLLNISFQKDAPPESLEAFFYPAIQSANTLNEVVWEQMRAPSPVFSLSVADVIMAIYLMGIFLMSFSLLKGLWNLGRIIRRGKCSKNNEFTLVETQNNFPAASFFGYIFWNQQITEEQQLILEHEKVHIRQWHSLDVLLMEICVIIKWFNPLIYWFRNALKATHEFIADQYVIQQKSNIGEYATLLVSQHRQQTNTPLTNTFYSLTKERLHKMIQRPSQTFYVTKYLLIFPMIIGLMSLFSFNLLEEIPAISEGITEMNTVLEDIGEQTVFEIDHSFLTKESTVLGQAPNELSEYKIHLGDAKYSAGIAAEFNSVAHHSGITLREVQTLLNNAIFFTEESEKIDINKISLIIPNPNVKYRTTNNSVRVGTPGEVPAFIIEATKAENFKFTKPAINAFLNKIHNGSNFYIYGYGKNEVFISEFLVDYATGEISNKEMDSFFYFPENPNNNKLRIGGKEIFMRGLESGGAATPVRINQTEFFTALREGNLTFTQNGKPLILDELYLTHASSSNNYTANIVKNTAGKFEIVESFDTPPFRVKADKRGSTPFSEETIQSIEANIREFDLIELRGKNKEDTYLKTIFFSEMTLRYNQNNHFESTTINPIFDTPSLINNQQLKFKWGNIELPIWHTKNPHFKDRSRFSISTTQLLENLNAEMLILDNNKIFDVHSMALDFIFYNNKEKNDADYLFTPPFKLLFKQGEPMKLFPNNLETLTKYINNFGEMYIKIPELGASHFVVIKVGEEGKPPIPSIPEPEVINYRYQVIMPKYRKNGKTVLRIDTTMARNKRIVNMYRNPSRYHIIHIPNFSTTENLLWKDTELIIQDDLNNWPDHSVINPFKSQYNGHIGDYSFSVGNAAAFNSETYKHRITDARLGELLQQSIRFTKDGDFVDVDKVELVIPYPDAIYNYDALPKETSAFIPNGSDDGVPFRVTTDKIQNFRFSVRDLAKFKSIIQHGTKVYLNGYTDKEILTSHFHILEAKGFEQAKNNLSELDAEMRQISPYKLQLGGTIIGLTATNSAKRPPMIMPSTNELIQGLQKNDLQFFNGNKIMNMEKIEVVGTNRDNKYGWNWSRNDNGEWQFSEDYAKKPIKIKTTISKNNRFSNEDIDKLLAVLPDLTMLHFYGSIEDTLYSAKVFIRQEKQQVQATNYQLKWGNYTFNCQEKNVDTRKTCNCEGLYINKADLTKINTIGIQFLKNEQPVDFENVYVSANGFVYCKEEDLMMSSDLQPNYNPDACIWNAFDEGERGTAGFQTKEFDNVNFTFAINSSKGHQRIEAPSIKIGTKIYPLPYAISSSKERPSFTFGEIKEMVNQPISTDFFGEIAEINRIKIQTMNKQAAWHYQALTDPVVFKILKNFYPDEKRFYLNLSPSGNDHKTAILFTMDSEEEFFKKMIHEFTWGQHRFTINNPFLALTKKELTNLIEHRQMKTYLGTPIEKITGIKFLYQDETVIYFGKKGNYDLKAISKQAEFKKNYGRLKTGDLINIMNLHSDFVEGGLTVFIKEDVPNPVSYFNIQSAKDGIQNQFNDPFITLYRNHSIATVLADLLDIHPSKLRFRDKENLPKIHLTYKPIEGVDAKKELLEKIKDRYPFTIKNKIVKEEAWFLSEGDKERMANYEEGKILGRQFEPFKRKNQEKGLETVGPVNFSWFASTYFKRKYQLEVINLTDFSGKYILPLDTQSLPFLQKQLERDFGLVLKKQRRSLEIKEVVFE